MANHYTGKYRYDESQSVPIAQVMQVVAKLEIGIMRPFAHKCPRPNGHTTKSCGWAQTISRYLTRDFPNRHFRQMLDKKHNTMWIARLFDR